MPTWAVSRALNEKCLGPSVLQILPRGLPLSRQVVRDRGLDNVRSKAVANSQSDWSRVLCFVPVLKETGTLCCASARLSTSEPLFTGEKYQ